MNRPASATQAYDKKREQLLRAAATCFNEKGYSGTSLKDVARHLGLTDAAIYYYMNNKRQLLFECYLRAVQAGEEAMTLGEDHSGVGLERARVYLTRHLELLCGESGPFAIMSEIPALDQEQRALILNHSRQHSRRFEALLLQGVKDGSIKDCDIRMTGNAIMGSINWIPKWFRGDAQQARQIVATFPAVLLGGLQCA
ncbi:MAG: TetR/AcrR family transcriptional regulator [Pseudomonadota bacterium]